MKGYCVFVACLCFSLARSEETHYNVYFGDSKCGTYEATVNADGSFQSKLEAKIATVKLDSSLKAHAAKGMLDSIDIETSQAGHKVNITWKDNKYTVATDGKVAAKDMEYKAHLAASFSIFHPALNSLLYEGLKAKAESARCVFIDNFAELPVNWKERTVTAQLSSGATPIKIWTGELGPVAVEFAFSQDGKPLGINIPTQKFAIVKENFDGIFADPLSEFKELSQATYKSITETRIRMAARDGVRLMADICRPDSNAKFPTILIRTPYGRAASLAAESWYAKRGYVVVSQDVRGRGGSDGNWDPLVHERADGKDTLDWITQQPWSDGKVGMIGGSYLGYVQWAAATTDHPALKCIIPQVSPPQPDMNFPWDHGSFMLLSNLWWCRIVKDRASSTASAFNDLVGLKSLMTLPITKADDKFFGFNIDFFDKWVNRPQISDWGDVFTTPEVAQVKIPALHVSGVWDGDGIGTAIHWSARNNPNDRLIFGPWTHLFNTSHKFGDQEYGSQGILKLEPIYLRFFDTYLKGKSVKEEDEPRVRFFVTGSNKWLETSSWPAPNSKPVTFYLNSGTSSGKLQSTLGQGSDSYNYNPLKPLFKMDTIAVNINGDSTVIPPVKNGEKSLIYLTEPFKTDTTLAAPTSAELYVSTSARDAAISVLVLDEDEKGVRRMICMSGTQRITYVDGKFVKIKPNQIVKISVEPWWFAHRFEKGHRLAILVQSDQYPRFARNPGTGEPDAVATKLVKATHTIYSNKTYPSKLTLWKID